MAEKLWNEKLAGYGVDFEAGKDSRYSELDLDVQIAGAFVKLDNDLLDGGFLQFFHNWGYSAFEFVIAGSEIIEVFDIIEPLDAALNVIANHQENESITTVLDIASLTNDDEKKALQNLVDKYTENRETIIKRLTEKYG